MSRGGGPIGLNGSRGGIGRSGLRGRLRPGRNGERTDDRWTVLVPQAHGSLPGGSEGGRSRLGSPSCVCDRGCAGSRRGGGWNFFGQVHNDGPRLGNLDLEERKGVALNFNDGGIEAGFVLSQEGLQVRSVDESRTLAENGVIQISATENNES